VVTGETQIAVDIRVPDLGNSRGESTTSKVGFCLRNVQGGTGLRTKVNDWIGGKIFRKTSDKSPRSPLVQIVG